jgi:hypothetical protein
MAQWTPEQQLAFDIAFGLKKVIVPGFRKALTEEDRFAIAAAIVGHLKLCRWEFSKPLEPSNKKWPQDGILRPFGFLDNSAVS